MAALGTHELGVNAMRFGPSKVERKQRVCKCCDKNVVDDERHVFECAELATLRAQHPLLSSLPIATDPDATMRTAIDMDADGKRWRALADYLIKHKATAGCDCGWNMTMLTMLLCMAPSCGAKSSEVMMTACGL